MAVDIQKLFNEEIPGKLAAHADAAKQIGATFQLNIVGEGGGHWLISATDAAQSVTKGEHPADCTITLAEEDFQTLLANPGSAGMQLFFAGKLKVAGNQMLAMKLQKLFTLGATA